MENAYIYTRVSTLIQVDGFSLEAQEAEIRAFAEARKINIVGKYTDEGKSGKNAEHRSAFTQMMEDIRSKKDNIRYVLVFKLSRFARNTSDTAKYLQELSSYGIGLLGIKDGIDTSTVNGRLAIVHSGQGALMANLNSENPHVGRKFQEFVQTILKEKYNTYFEQEAAIPIGRPPKEHKFDLANADRSIVAECKCYTWTDSGNVPSAKLMGLDEAVFYFGFLPSGTKKLLCMKKAVFRGKQETLAEYYVRAHGHLLEDVSVIEISDDGTIKIVRDGASIPAEAYYG